MTNNPKQVIFPANWLKDCWRISLTPQEELNFSLDVPDYDKPASKPRLCEVDRMFYEKFFSY